MPSSAHHVTQLAMQRNHTCQPCDLVLASSIPHNLLDGWIFFFFWNLDFLLEESSAFLESLSGFRLFESTHLRLRVEDKVRRMYGWKNEGTWAMTVVIAATEDLNRRSLDLCTL